MCFISVKAQIIYHEHLDENWNLFSGYLTTVLLRKRVSMLHNQVKMMRKAMKDAETVLEEKPLSEDNENELVMFCGLR